MAVLGHGAARAVRVYDGEKLRLGFKAIRDAFPFLRAVQKRVAGGAAAEEENLRVAVDQLAPAAGARAGRFGQLLAAHVVSRVRAQRGDGMRGMQRAHDARALQKQVRQDARAGGLRCRVHHRIVPADARPRVRGEDQKAVPHVFDKRVQHRVRPSLHIADGLHRRVHEQGAAGVYVHGFKAKKQILLGIHSRFLSIANAKAIRSRFRGGWLRMASLPIYSQTTIWCRRTCGVVKVTRLPSHSKGMGVSSGAR